MDTFREQDDHFNLYDKLIELIESKDIKEKTYAIEFLIFYISEENMHSIEEQLEFSHELYKYNIIDFLIDVLYFDTKINSESESEDYLNNEELILYMDLEQNKSIQSDIDNDYKRLCFKLLIDLAELNDEIKEHLSYYNFKQIIQVINEFTNLKYTKDQCERALLLF
jgi:hypothetical protein